MKVNDIRVLTLYTIACSYQVCAKRWQPGAAPRGETEAAACKRYAAGSTCIAPSTAIIWIKKGVLEIVSQVAGCGAVVQEGAGHAVMSAYVEIVFDNSDGRIPVRPCAFGHAA